MDLTKLLRLMPEEERTQIQKVIDIFQIGGRSKKTIDNYVCTINRFLKYFESKDISKLDENDIVEYIKHNYLNKSCSANTYNVKQVMTLFAQKIANYNS